MQDLLGTGRAAARVAVLAVTTAVVAALPSPVHATPLDTAPLDAAPTDTAPTDTAPTERGSTTRPADTEANGAGSTDIAVSMTSTAVPEAPRTGPRHAQTPGAAMDVVSRLPATRTKEFGLVGVTWEADFGSKLTAQIKARVDGEWTGWQDLEIHADQQLPNSDARAGTAPIWVGDADGVAARVRSANGQAPKGVEVVTLDGGTGLAEPSNATDPSATGPSGTGQEAAQMRPASFRRAPVTSTAVVAGPRSEVTKRPDIVTRREWGVNREWEISCSEPRTASKLKGIVLHHTAGSNSYSRAEAPGIVRAIHQYHTKARNWCDIGYNFLVDKYGTIYQGRRGGIKKQVRGAHAGNWEVNLYTTGVAMIGNFEERHLRKPLKNSVVRLVAWRLSSFGLGANGKIKFDGERIHRISGHRDVYLAGIRPATATVCPGRWGYKWLGRSHGLRERVTSHIANAE